MAEAVSRAYADDAVFSPDPVFCKKVPTLFSSFVDTFVDFVVGGQVLGPIAPSLYQKLSPSESKLDEGGLEGKLPEPAVEGGGIRTYFPAPERLIAIGDIHGDIAKARAALQTAEVIDENDHWIGGKTVVVQVGDLLDRGGEEIKVIYLLEKLRGEAQRAGGDVHIMNGNHEIMNIEGDFRYATHAGLAEFRGWAHWFNLGNVLKGKCAGLGKQPDIYENMPDSYPEGLRARIAALRPGGPISSRFLSNHPTVLMVGASVFVHGGLLPAHVELGLDRINEEVRDWMLGRRGWRGPSYLHRSNAVVWLRKYSDVIESECDCQLLTECLDSISGAKRMVVGHTIQYPIGLNGACDNKVIRVDVGLSKGCGDGEPQVLEIRGDNELRVLSARAPPQVMNAGDFLKGNDTVPKEDKSGLASLLEQAPKTYI